VENIADHGTIGPRKFFLCWQKEKREGRKGGKKEKKEKDRKRIERKREYNCTNK
jgi:hypothetical protein